MPYGSADARAKAAQQIAAVDQNEAILHKMVNQFPPGALKVLEIVEEERPKLKSFLRAGQAPEWDHPPIDAATAIILLSAAQVALDRIVGNELLMRAEEQE